MEDIIAQIWALPWHQVIIVAFVDDFILLVKVWPALVGILVFVVFQALMTRRGR